MRDALLLGAALFEPAGVQHLSAACHPAQARLGGSMRILALVVLTYTSHALAQNVSTQPEFALTVAGGISLGSYEAGVNWALLRTLKQPLSNGVHPRLMSVTGASAGNVNAFLSAMTWCQANDTDAVDDNLFHDLWMNVGVETLFPIDQSCEVAENALGIDPQASQCEKEWRDLHPDDALRLANEPEKIHRLAMDAPAYRPDDGLLSRRAFSLFQQELAARLNDKSRPFGPCDVDIGVTATKTVPVELSLSVDDKAKASAQRFVAAFKTKTVGTGLQFHRWRDDAWWQLLNSSSASDDSNGASALDELGPVLRLPTVGAGTEVDIQTVFGLVEASSAFPWAFGPRSLEYCVTGQEAQIDPLPHGTVPPLGSCGPQLQRREARFLDGGVFDNEPLGLAIHMLRQRGPLSPRRLPQAKQLVSDRQVFFIDPDTRRVEPAHEKIESKLHGLGYLLDIVDDFVETGRSYERQAVHRYARDDLAGLRPSTRESPIFGEHLGAFGAFPARSFREYDFYAGVYDGLRRAAAARCEWEGEPTQDACIWGEMERGLGRLLSRDSDANDDVRFIVSQLAMREATNPADYQQWVTKSPAPKREVFRSYVNALQAFEYRDLIIQQARAAARSSGIEEERVEFAYFRLMEQLRTHKTVDHLKKELAIEKEKLKPGSKTTQEFPWLDDEIEKTIAMIEWPNENLLRMTRYLLTRASAIERRDKQGMPLAAVRIAQIGVETYFEQMSPSWALPGAQPYLNPLLKPDWFSIATGHTLPTHAALVVNRGGFDFGWDLLRWPLVHFDDGPIPSSLGFNTTLTYLDLATEDALFGQRFVGGSARLMWRNESAYWWGLSRAEIGYRINFGTDPLYSVVNWKVPYYGSFDSFHGPEIVFGGLADKLYLSASFNATALVWWPVHRDVRQWPFQQNLIFAVGINDIPGFTYWSGRWLMESMGCWQ